MRIRIRIRNPEGQDPDPDLSSSGSIILDTVVFYFFHMTWGALPDTETEPETQTITRYLGMTILLLPVGNVSFPFVFHVFIDSALCTKSSQSARLFLQSKPGLPHPLTRKWLCTVPPFGSGGGGTHSLAGQGVGESHLGGGAYTVVLQVRYICTLWLFKSGSALINIILNTVIGTLQKNVKILCSEISIFKVWICLWDSKRNGSIQ